MNRINQKLKENKKLLSIYFTAGYPKIDDTVSIIQNLEKSGVDMIEIGLPFRLMAQPFKPVQRKR